MKFSLALDHPMWTLSSHVAQHSQEFMSSHGLSYFQYLRCYSDGAIACLVSSPELFKTFLIHDFPVLSTFESNHEKYPSYIFFWDEELPSIPVNIAREKHGMYHGITLVKRHKDFYDMIGFAMTKPKSNAMAYYFNHLKTFEKFAENFIQKRTDLVSIYEREKIYLPQHLQDRIIQKYAYQIVHDAFM